MRILSALVPGAAVLLLSSCDPFYGDYEVGICDTLHGVLGSQAVTAVSSGQEQAFSDATNNRITVTLVPVTGGNGGRVSMTAGPGDHYFFMSDVPLAVEDDQGNALTVSDCPLQTVECGSTVYRACRKVNIGRGDIYHLDFGPTSAASASFAIRVP